MRFTPQAAIRCRFAPEMRQTVAEFIDPASLVVQYCFRNQETLDRLLAFSHAEHV